MQKNYEADKWISRALTAITVSFGITVICAALIAWLVRESMIDENGIGFATMIVTVLGSVASSVIMVRAGQGKRLWLCLGGGAVYLLLLLLGGNVFFDGYAGGLLPTASVVVSGSMVVYLLGFRVNKQHRFRVPKTHLRNMYNVHK